MDYRLVIGTVREGVFEDTKRLVAALGIDGYGMASTVGYLLGIAPGVALDSADMVTGPAQTAYIMAAYWSDLTVRDKAIVGALSMAEEMLPGLTDLVPTVTTAHFLAAYRRVQRGSAIDADYRLI